MDVHNHHQLGERDQSIITGFGRFPSDLEEDVDLLLLDGPQATSTVGTKKSRHDVFKDYADCLDSERMVTLENEPCCLTQVPCLIDMSQNTLHSQLSSLKDSHGPSYTDSNGCTTSASLINVVGMSGLSASKFLVDHTQLSQYQNEEVNHIPSPSNGPERNCGLPANDALSEDEYDTDSVAPKFTGEELEGIEADLSEYEDLSQGEDEECIASGLGEQYLYPTHDILRSGTHSSHDDFSQALSAVSQLNSSNQNKEHSRFSDVRFDAAQISARSTMLGHGLEDSKFLSASCNSLGSLGESAKEDIEDDDLVHSERQDMIDWFQTDQDDLGSILNGESFHAIDRDFLEEEEKDNAKKNIFMQEESCTGAALEFSHLSGLHEIGEITVRPSWIHSPEKDLLLPGKRMHIEDFLKMRSESLGSLGNSDNEDRPDFGLGKINSPPNNEAKLVPLVEMTAVSNIGQSYLQPEENAESSDTLGNRSSSSILSQSASERTGSSSSGSSTFTASRDSTKGAIPKNRMKETCSAPNPKSSNETFKTPLPVEDNRHLYAGLKAKVTNPKSDSQSLENEKFAEENMTNHAKKVLGVEQIRQLLKTSALSNGNAQLLINKILHNDMNKSEFHNTTDMTELDASTEVLELRAKREALMSSKSQSKKHQEVKGKENICSVAHMKHFQNSDRIPLQPAGHTGKSERPVNKHMERLKVLRTGSAPLQPTQESDGLEARVNCHTKAKQSGTDLVEIAMDETLRGIPYKSRILEDSQKSQLTSFHDSTNSGFDSSTPCAPRSRTRTNPSKACQNENPLVIRGNQLYTKDRRPANNAKVAHRPLPKMGLASSLVRMPGAKNCHDARGDVDPRNCNESSVVVTNWQSSRSESTLYPHSPNSSDGDSRLSSSVPSGLQALGNPTTLQRHTRPLNGTSPRQHRSQESIASDRRSQSTEDKVLFPKEIAFSNSCILGIGSEEVITFFNPKHRWVQLSIRLMQETVNNKHVGTSALLFKPSYFVEPRNTIEIRFSLCSHIAGSWGAVLEMKVSDLSKGSGNMTAPNVSIHTVILSAQIEEPSVQLSCEGEEVIDFGVVPESCIVSREVTVINQSSQPIPAILTLRQVPATSPVFFWNEVEDTCKVVSPSHLAYELPSGDSETGPIPLTVNVFLKAPHLDRVEVNESGVCEVESLLQVELDTPNQSTIIISSMKIKALIGVVRLQHLCSVEPLTLEAKSDESCSASVPLKNSSSFPLHLSLETREYKDHFVIHPSSLMIPPHATSSVTVVFTPKERIGEMESVLFLCVEPKGKLYEISILGKSYGAPRLLVKSAAPIQRTRSAPVPSQVNLKSALKTSKSEVAFGTVAVGDKAWKKLVLWNNCPTQVLSLCIVVADSKAFQVCAMGGKDGKSLLNAVLEPNQELALCVFFTPTTVEATKGCLICKPRGLPNPIKFQIPLQGYGGQGKLLIPDSSDGEPFIIRDISPHQPAMFHTALANTGDREMFLKLRLFADEKCTELISMKDISVQPQDLLLKPKDNRDVFIIVNGTTSVMARIPGCLAFLQIIYGDEILRRRFRKNKAAKVRHVNDPGLLKIDWDVFFSGERDEQAEDVILPLRSDDARIFYSSCSKIQVRLDGEKQVIDDTSSIAFTCLEAEYTMNSVSMADISMQPDRITELHPSIGQPAQEQDTASQMRQAIAQQSNPSWDVFPQAINVSGLDTTPHTFFVVNYSNNQQILEISSTLKWLSVDPQEAMLPGLSSVKVTAKLNHSVMPKPITSPVVGTLKIMCEQESRCATVTIMPDTSSSSSSSGLNGSSPSLFVTPPTPNERQLIATPRAPPSSQTQQAASINSAVNNSANRRGDMKTSSSTKPHRVLPESTGISTLPKTSTQRSNDNLQSDRKEVAEEKCLVEVTTSTVTYPDTAKSKESFVKIKLRNLDSIVHPMKAKISNLPFMVRHHEFEIQPGHYVGVPVYFRPDKPGKFTGQLNLTVVKTNKVLTVQLSGTAV